MPTPPDSCSGRNTMMHTCGGAGGQGGPVMVWCACGVRWRNAGSAAAAPRSAQHRRPSHPLLSPGRPRCRWPQRCARGARCGTDSATAARGAAAPPAAWTARSRPTACQRRTTCGSTQWVAGGSAAWVSLPACRSAHQCRHCGQGGVGRRCRRLPGIPARPAACSHLLYRVSCSLVIEATMSRAVGTPLSTPRATVASGLVCRQTDGEAGSVGCR